MITFKQFLEEQQPNEVLELITKHCQPFLDEAKRSGFLYRGVKINTGLPGETADLNGEELQYVKKTTRTDRKPKDMSEYKSKHIDQWFEKKFGFRARSECVFALGEGAKLTDLRHYGTPCAIFPIGEMQYVWSRNVEDLWNDTAHMSSITSPEAIHEWLDNADYRDTDFVEALNSNREIMVKCSGYYAFPIEYEERLKMSLGFPLRHDSK